MQKPRIANLIRRISQTEPKTGKALGAVGAIVVVTIIFFSPLLSGSTFSMVGPHMYAQYPWVAGIHYSASVTGLGFPQTDHAETFYPANVFATQALRNGEFPMWFPYSFAGIPILEVGVGTALLYPPKLFLMFFLSPIRQHDCMLFMHFLVAGLGMFALLRCWGANVLGAILGALVWELSGTNTLSMLWEHVAIIAAWFPLMLLGATLAIRRRSFIWALTTGVAVGMATLEGILFDVYVSVVVLGFFYGLFASFAAGRLFLTGERRAALKCLSLPLISAIVAATLSAASWLAILDILPRAHRQPQTLQDQLADSISFSRLIRALVLPESASGPAGKAPDTPGLAYTGLPALFLALVALFRRSMPVLLGLLICLFSMGFSLGYAPLVRVLRVLFPYFGAVHTYSGWFLFCFSMAVLAAFGVSEVGRRFGRSGIRNYILFGLGLLLLTVEAWLLISFGWSVNPIHPATSEWLFPETPFITALKNLQGEHHILPVAHRAPSGQWVPVVLAGKVAGDFGLRSGSGYESLLPVPTAVIWRTVEQSGVPSEDIPIVYRPYFYHDTLPITLLENISVGLLATPPATQPRDANGNDLTANGRIQPVYQGRDGWVYKVVRALPRAFLVPRVLAASNPSASLRMLADETFDARAAAIVTGELTPEQAVLLKLDPAEQFEESASITSDRLNDVGIEVATSHAAMLVLNDSWDDGWKAYVDGVEKPVAQVNYAFRGVTVPKGSHRVTFSYRPMLLLVGLYASGISILLLTVSYLIVAARTLRRMLATKRTPIH